MLALAMATWLRWVSQMLTTAESRTTLDMMMATNR